MMAMLLCQWSFLEISGFNQTNTIIDLTADRPQKNENQIPIQNILGFCRTRSTLYRPPQKDLHF